MTIYYNNEKIEIPGNCQTISDLLTFKGVKTSGTAVAIEDSIICSDCWKDTLLKDGDKVTVISAAFGG